MRIMLLALSALLVIPGIAHADPLQKDHTDESFTGWVWRGLTDEAHLRVGYGVVQWALDVTRASDGATARLVQRDNSAVFISYGSKPSFFKDTNFGYTFMVNYVDFSMTKQSIPGDKFADLGTDLEVETPVGKTSAVVVQKPFIDPKKEIPKQDLAEVGTKRTPAS